MKYNEEVYIRALEALAELREKASEKERNTIDFIAEAIAEKGDRENFDRKERDKLDALDRRLEELIEEMHRMQQDILGGRGGGMPSCTGRRGLPTARPNNNDRPCRGKEDADG